MPIAAASGARFFQNTLDDIEKMEYIIVVNCAYAAAVFFPRRVRQKILRRKNMKRTLPVFILSILILAAIVFLPMFQPLGGTFNFKADLDFFDVFNFVKSGGDTSSSMLDWSSWPVIFTLAAAIPAILLFFFSLFGSKILSILASLAGILGMGYTLFMYGKNANSVGAFFGDKANLSIGLWIVCALFIIAFICALAAPKKAPKPEKKKN